LNDPNQNPFQSPKDYDALPVEKIESPGDARPQSPLILIFAKWAVICAVSAAPSFIVAHGMHGGTLAGIFGMVSGVFLFVLLYTFAETRKSTRNLLSQKRVRIIARIGYGTRMAASIIFPVGMTIDIVCGLVSTSLTSLFFNFGSAAPGLVGAGSDHSELALFTWHFFTTIVQGILLNIVLLTYMLVIYGISWIFFRPKSRFEHLDDAKRLKS
jgi:hypothetical protein